MDGLKHRRAKEIHRTYKVVKKALYGKAVDM